MTVRAQQLNTAFTTTMPSATPSSSHSHRNKQAPKSLARSTLHVKGAGPCAIIRGAVL